MNKKLTAMLLAAALATVTACGSDDDDDGGVGTDVGGGDGGVGTDVGGGDGGGSGGDSGGSGGGDAGGGDAGGGDGVVTAAGSYQITITNMTSAQLMTPPVVAIHDAGTHLFQIGEPASDAIRDIAETGDNAALVEAAGGLAAVHASGVAGDGPFGAGQSVTTTLSLESDQVDQVFSVVNMVICTHDGISGTDSHELPADNNPLTFTAVAYDAGTRVNDGNVLTMFPPPCRLDPFALPPVEADVRPMAGEAVIEDPRAAIAAHAGQSNLTNAAAGTNWNFEAGEAVMQIEIVRN